MSSTLFQRNTVEDIHIFQNTISCNSDTSWDETGNEPGLGWRGIGGKDTEMKNENYENNPPTPEGVRNESKIFHVYTIGIQSDVFRGPAVEAEPYSYIHSYYL